MAPRDDLPAGAVDITAEIETMAAAADRHNGPHPGHGGIIAAPFQWLDPATIPQRQWLYGRHLIRGFVAADIAPGGYGKSSLIVAEALAMVTGRPLLGDEPAGRLRVWQINLEDPRDELQRRFAAAAIHHRVRPEDIGGRLFVNSGRDTSFVIATETRDGVQIASPVIEAIKAEILNKAIDVLQVDPFVACHGVTENDNTKISAVVRQWAMLAEATGCAVVLVHHARKGGGQAFGVEDARGASALIAAVRSARVLNGMTREEAERANIDNPASYFNIINGKANLAPRSDKATWLHIVGVPLGNGCASDPNGDYVGVVEPWSWPDPFADVGIDDAKEIQRRIAKGEFRVDHRSTTWAGNIVAEVIGFDLSDTAARATVQKLLNGWVATGALRVVTRKDKKRVDRRFFEVGQWLP
jgi:hypothetical protein